MVAPVAVSLAEAYVQRKVAWPRLITDGGRAVAFVMAAFQLDTEPVGCALWRRNVAADTVGERRPVGGRPGAGLARAAGTGGSPPAPRCAAAAGPCSP